MSELTGSIILIIVIAVLALAFVLLRRIVLWYLRINEQVALLEEIVKLLKAKG